MTYAELEQYDEALQNVQQSYAVYEEIGQRRGMAGSLAVMGSIYRKQGQRRKARRYLHESLLLSQEVGVIWVAISLLVEMAELEISYGSWQQAALLLGFAVQHPAIQAPALATAQKLLDELKAELPENVMAEVEVAAAQHTLDSLIAQLVAGGEAA
jgi:tetratricopeptide (TPR) repeat protein